MSSVTIPSTFTIDLPVFTASLTFWQGCATVHVAPAPPGRTYATCVASAHAPPGRQACDAHWECAVHAAQLSFTQAGVPPLHAPPSTSVHCTQVPLSRLRSHTANPAVLQSLEVVHGSPPPSFTRGSGGYPHADVETSHAITRARTGNTTA
ncbi:MAG TPA: hypothetical protein VIX73_04785 [Kofleriaceae bacterium]